MITKKYLMKEIRKAYNLFNKNIYELPEFQGAIVGEIRGYMEILRKLDMISDNSYDLLYNLTSRMLMSI